MTSHSIQDEDQRASKGPEALHSPAPAVNSPLSPARCSSCSPPSYFVEGQARSHPGSLPGQLSAPSALLPFFRRLTSLKSSIKCYLVNKAYKRPTPTPFPFSLLYFSSDQRWLSNILDELRTCYVFVCLSLPDYKSANNGNLCVLCLSGCVFWASGIVFRTLWTHTYLLIEWKAWYCLFDIYF